MDIKLKNLLGIIEKELVKAEKNYHEAKKSASEVAHSASLSPSQAGDRFHSEHAANLARSRVEALKRLKEEVKSGKAQYIDQTGGFFLVKNITLLPGIKLVSLDSPVGKELAKSVGQS